MSDPSEPGDDVRRDVESLGQEVGRERAGGSAAGAGGPGASDGAGGAAAPGAGGAAGGGPPRRLAGAAIASVGVLVAGAAIAGGVLAAGSPSPTSVPSAAPTTQSATAPTTLPATTVPVPATTLPPPTTTSPVPTTTLPAPATTAPPPAGTGSSSPATVTVRPGDSFWALASRIAAERAGGTPSPAQVATLWRSMVVANASRLYDPDDNNPNLIYPGQVFVVPAT